MYFFISYRLLDRDQDATLEADELVAFLTRAVEKGILLDIEGASTHTAQSLLKEACLFDAEDKRTGGASSTSAANKRKEKLAQAGEKTPGSDAASPHTAEATAAETPQAPESPAVPVSPVSEAEAASLRMSERVFKAWVESNPFLHSVIEHVFTLNVVQQICDETRSQFHRNVESEIIKRLPMEEHILAETYTYIRDFWLEVLFRRLHIEDAAIALSQATAKDKDKKEAEKDKDKKKGVSDSSVRGSVPEGWLGKLYRLTASLSGQQLSSDTLAWTAADTDRVKSQLLEQRRQLLSSSDLEYTLLHNRLPTLIATNISVSREKCKALMATIDERLYSGHVSVYVNKMLEAKREGSEFAMRMQESPDMAAELDKRRYLMTADLDRDIDAMNQRGGTDNVKQQDAQKDVKLDVKKDMKEEKKEEEKSVKKDEKKPTSDKIEPMKGKTDDSKGKDTKKEIAISSLSTSASGDKDGALDSSSRSPIKTPLNEVKTPEKETPKPSDKKSGKLVDFSDLPETLSDDDDDDDDDDEAMSSMFKKKTPTPAPAVDSKVDKNQVTTAPTVATTPAIATANSPAATSSTPATTTPSVTQSKSPQKSPLDDKARQSEQARRTSVDKSSLLSSQTPKTPLRTTSNTDVLSQLSPPNLNKTQSISATLTPYPTVDVPVSLPVEDLTHDAVVEDIIPKLLTTFRNEITMNYLPFAVGPAKSGVLFEYVYDTLANYLIILTDPFKYYTVRRVKRELHKKYNKDLALVYERLNTLIEQNQALKQVLMNQEQIINKQTTTINNMLMETENMKDELATLRKQNELLKTDMNHVICVKELALSTLRDEVQFYEKENMTWSDRLAQLHARNQDLMRQNELQQVEITHLRTKGVPSCCTVM